MKMTLKDGAPRSVGHVDINVSKNGNTVEIGPVGVEPAPIVLEFYEGKLKLRVYGDPATATQQPEFVTTLNASPATAPVVTFDRVAEVPQDPTKPYPSPSRRGAEPVTAQAPATDDDLAAFDAA